MMFKQRKLRNLFLAAASFFTLSSTQAHATAATSADVKAIASTASGTANADLIAHRRAYLELAHSLENGSTELEFSQVYEALRNLLIDRSQNAPYPLEDLRMILRSAWQGGVFDERKTDFPVKLKLLDDLGVTSAQYAVEGDLARYHEVLNPDYDLQSHFLLDLALYFHTVDFHEENSLFANHARLNALRVSSDVQADPRASSPAKQFYLTQLVGQAFTHILGRRSLTRTETDAAIHFLESLASSKAIAQAKDLHAQSQANALWFAALGGALSGLLGVAAYTTVSYAMNDITTIHWLTQTSAWEVLGCPVLGGAAVAGTLGQIAARSRRYKLCQALSALQLAAEPCEKMLRRRP
jgi:hypothetical protein